MELRKDTRKLHIDNDIWQYKIGKVNVVIYSPEGERYFPTKAEVINKEEFKNGYDYLNPAIIVNYILKLTGKEIKHQECKVCHKAHKTVRLRLDPFNVEIYDDYTKVFMCDSCVDFRYLEI